MEYFTIKYGNYILCSGYKWMNKETHDGTFFNKEEIDYMIDRWNKNDSIDTTELIIKPYIKGE